MPFFLIFYSMVIIVKLKEQHKVNKFLFNNYAFN